MPRHVILIGLPGSGKSTVGPLLAERLRAPFDDVDAAVEARDGRTIGRIFREDGEAAFRALERAVGQELLSLPPRVLAVGGGFLQAPDLARLALEKGLVVYLETSPEAAAARVGDGRGRPLLEGGEVPQRLRRLLEQRQAIYLQAHQRVSTDRRTPAAVADVISELARGMGGW